MFRKLFYLLKNLGIKFSFKHIKVAPSCRIKAKISNIFGNDIFCRGAYFDGTIGKYSIIGPDSRIIAKIGNYCSIGPNVKTVNATHPTDMFSTSVFVNRKLYKNVKDDLGPVIIGNDVWIGENALIKGGVAIGDGAVIGMGSVVTKDVPPFAIVAGCPAKIIRMRFEQEKIDRIIDSNWFKKDLKDLNKPII